MMKSKRKTVLLYITGFIGLIGIYIVLLMLGRMIPQKYIETHLEESLIEIQKEGLYLSEADDAISYDNWTTSFYLNAIATRGKGNILQQAISNTITVLEDEKATVLDALESAVHNDENVILSDYSRYWAGNATLYKIMLIFFSLGTIRVILFSINLCLFLFFLYMSHEQVGKKCTLAFVAAFLMHALLTLSFCLTYFSDIFLILMGLIGVCRLEMRKSSRKVHYLFFFMIGSLVAYVGYWAFPLLTLGLPLVFYTNKKQKDGIQDLTIVKDDLLFSICWGIGLVGTVLSKQILCKLILGNESGFSQMAFRMGKGWSLQERIRSCRDVIIRAYENEFIMTMLGIMVVLLCICICSGAYRKSCKFYPYFLIMLYPVVWNLILAQHSAHSFVKYVYVLSSYAMLIYFANNVHLKEIRIENVISKKYIYRNVIWIACCIGLGIFMKCSTLTYNYDTFEPWSLSDLLLLH